jgi:type II secretory pathway pseudopilin PulG
MIKKLLNLKNRAGQVWIETVIYTLIAFVMIGLVLAYARPKIQEIQDQALLKQSIDLLKQIDSTLLSMGSAGNQRILEISIKKGELKIDAEYDKIIFEMESKSLYSEPGKEITDGSVIILTNEGADTNLVSLTLDYDDVYNLKILGKDELRTLSAASTPYKFSILNEGADTNGEPVMNLTIS